MRALALRKIPSFVLDGNLERKGKQLSAEGLKSGWIGECAKESKLVENTAS